MIEINLKKISSSSAAASPRACPDEGGVRRGARVRAVVAFSDVAFQVRLLIFRYLQEPKHD